MENPSANQLKYQAMTQSGMNPKVDAFSAKPNSGGQNLSS
jgi:hypothetical protein